MAATEDYDDLWLSSLLASRDSTARTPLHMAARQGHVEVCELLLARGADVLAPEGHGAPPLVLASFEGHEDVVRSLLRGRAQVKQGDYKGRNAFHVAPQRTVLLKAVWVLK